MNGQSHKRENDKINDETLEMKAKNVLNDISNQDDPNTRLNWYKKTSRCIRLNKNGIKLPKL